MHVLSGQAALAPKSKPKGEGNRSELCARPPRPHKPTVALSAKEGK